MRSLNIATGTTGGINHRDREKVMVFFMLCIPFFWRLELVGSLNEPTIHSLLSNSSQLVNVASRAKHLAWCFD